MPERQFLFCTGIENSYPTIRLGDGKTFRVDEMESCGHYRRWRDDFRLVKELGLTHLRWGPPYYRTHTGSGAYDWGFCDEAMNELRRLGIVPVIDLCHFGVPDWLGSFQNPEFPGHFAEYCGAFAARYPWVHWYTPVNEIFIAATFSAQYGWWNERLASDRAFVTALKHLCKANLLGMDAILRVQPTALFVQSESSEYFHAESPSCNGLAQFLNEKRFLALDLTYGVPVGATMYEYLTDNGMSREELHYFLEKRAKSHCVMGNDYYVTNEHLVREDGTWSPAGEVFGYYVITHQYFQRYRLPVMHTETNLHDAEKAPHWLRKQWANVHRLKQDGVPLIGFTWYSLTDQIDWDIALREARGTVNPCGLFTLDREIRPVGEAYRELVRQWRSILPTESLGLRLS